MKVVGRLVLVALLALTHHHLIVSPFASLQALMATMVACVDDIPAEIGATTVPPVPFPLPPQFTAPFTETFYSEVGPIFGCLAFRSHPLTPLLVLGIT